MTKVRTLTLNIYSEDFQTDQIHGTILVQPGYKNEYDIILNESLSEDEKTLAAVHEFLHAWHDDFNLHGKSVSEIESERHAEVLRIFETLI